MNSIPELVADKLLGGLRAVQFKQRPDSVFLTPEQTKQALIARGYTWDAIGEHVRFWPGVWYQCINQEWLGYRYGPEPHEYLSY